MPNDTIYCAICGAEIEYDKSNRRWTAKHVDELTLPVDHYRKFACYDKLQGKIFHEPLGNPRRLIRRLKEIDNRKSLVT